MVLEMVRGYDKIEVNYGVLLDLPFNEGSGIATHDIAKSHHQDITLVGPTWDKVALSNAGVLNFDGLTDYLECPAADTLDLDFIGDYSILCWINWEDTGIAGEIVVGRYDIDVAHSGWELYLAATPGVDSLTTRHHHAGTLVPPITGNPRSACYSVGWTRGVWCLLGVSRAGGGEAQHYRNGVPLAMVTSGLHDPEPCSEDLVVGVRWTKNATYYKGMMKGLRLWGRALSAEEMMDIFETERPLFGV